MKNLNTHALLLPNVHLYRVILVTGPQRSGTTFMAQAIAHDTERPYVDEEVFSISDHGLWRHIIEDGGRIVVQCPAMMKYVHDVPDDVMVVVMRRSVGDIVASEKRIGWEGNDLELASYGVDSGISSEVKYSYWDENKHFGPAHWVEVDYSKMRNHPMWVEKEARLNFGPKQTRVG